MRRKKGFTLMEMLIVVAIIGILVAIAVPVFSTTMSKARQTACTANMRNTKMALSLKEMTEGSLTDDMVKTALEEGLGKPVTEVNAGGKKGWTGLCPSGGMYTIDLASLVVECTEHGKTEIDRLTESDEKIEKLVQTAFGTTLSGKASDILNAYFLGTGSSSLNSTGTNWGSELKAELAKSSGVDPNSFDFRLYYVKGSDSCKIYLFDPLDASMIDTKEVNCKGYELEMKKGADGNMKVGKIINRVESPAAVVAGTVDGKTIPVIKAESIKW